MTTIDTASLKALVDELGLTREQTEKIVELSLMLERYPNNDMLMMQLGEIVLPNILERWVLDSRHARGASLRRYELCEHYRRIQRDGSGKGWVERCIFECDTMEEASKVAREALNYRDDDSRYPWIAVIEHAVEDGEETGWSAGWITADGVFHPGDYENDPELWGAP